MRKRLLLIFYFCEYQRKYHILKHDQFDFEKIEKVHPFLEKQESKESLKTIIEYFF